MTVDEFVDACRRMTDEHPLIVEPPGWTVFRLSTIGSNPSMQHLTPAELHEGAVWDFFVGARIGAVLAAMRVDGQDGHLLTAVHRDHPALVVARHFDGTWENINLAEAPWLTLSTAGALRAFFIDGTRAPMKDRRLYGNILQAAPPVDEHGVI